MPPNVLISTMPLSVLRVCLNFTQCKSGFYTQKSVNDSHLLHVETQKVRCRLHDALQQLVHPHKLSS